MGLTQKLGTIPLAIFTDSSNNVGIGAAASGSYKLQVTGTTNLTGALSGTSGTFSSLEVYDNSNSGILKLSRDAGGQRGQLQFGRNNGGSFQVTGMIGSDSDSASPNNGTLYFYTSNSSGVSTQRLIINGTGAATFSSSSGIGVTIQADWDRSATNNSQLYIRGNSNTNKQLRLGYDTTGNVGYIQALTSGTSVDNLLLNPSGGNVGIGTPTPIGKLNVKGGRFIVTATATDSNTYVEHNGTEGRIGVTYDTGGSYAPLTFLTSDTPRMTITSGGQVTIQTPTSGTALLTYGKANEWTIQSNASTTSGQSFGLKVVAGTTTGDVSFSVNNAADTINFFKIRGGDAYTQAIGVYNNTSATANYVVVTSDGGLQRYVASSQKYKEQILDWNASGLDTILALKPKTFKYKKDYYDKADVDFLGLIAEEVAEVCPYLADYSNEDRTGDVENVRYSTIVVPLIAAIQELEARIKQLENK